MNTHEKYVNEKTKLAYEKATKGKKFEKARAIILKDKKVCFIRDLTTGVITVPGGGIDEGESVEDAVVRETMEETGIYVRPIMPIDENEYDVQMNYGSTHFVSKRVAHIYLCEFIKQKRKNKGLKGEYENDTEIFFGEIDNLEICKIEPKAISKIKNYVSLNQNKSK